MAGADRCVGCGGILPEGYGWSHDICPVETENDVRKDIQADIPEESQDTPQETSKKSVNILHFVWPVLVLAAVLFLWRVLLFSIRRAAIGKGSPNRRAVTLYHHICWLARQTKTDVPPEFLDIAEKARFSHHKLNREDLLPLQNHADQLTKQLLADKRFWKQALYRVVYALG